MSSRDLNWGSKSYPTFVVAAAVAGLLGLCQCGGGGDGRIPISTSSSAAREAFLAGAELCDNLRFHEAQQYFDKAIDADPQFALAYLYSAISEQSAKGYFEHIQLAGKYAARASEGEQLLIEAMLAGANGDPATQIELLRELARQYPRDPRALMFLAAEYFGQREYDSAVSVCEDIVRIAPGYAPPYNVLGYSYNFLEDYEAAGRAFQEYIRLIPDDPKPYDSYAELLTRQGQFEAAIEQYRKSLAHDPSFGASRIGISANLVFMGRHDEARMELEKLFESGAGIGHRRAAIVGFAVTYVDQGDLETGLARLEELYRLDSTMSDPAAMSDDLNTMIFLLARLGRFDEAQQRLAQSVEIIDKSELFPRIKRNARQNAYLYQSLIYRERGRLSEARQQTEAYLTEVEPLVNPARTRSAYLSLGLVSLAEGDYAQAISHLEQSDLLQAWTLYHLAKAYEGLGDITRAAELFDRAARTYQLNSITYALIRQDAGRRADELRAKMVP
ncbi:MAG: tetratricopeptide repeat protein [Candidatus Zixiibacteriota bacterium]